MHAKSFGAIVQRVGSGLMRLENLTQAREDHSQTTKGYLDWQQTRGSSRHGPIGIERHPIQHGDAPSELCEQRSAAWS